MKYRFINKGAVCCALFGSSFLAPNLAHAAVVSTIDVGGDVNITNELGSFTSTAMQTLITTTADLTVAGVLDAEGTFGSGNFSNDTGALSDAITGTTRYGRDRSTSHVASGDRWGFISGSGTETWTPDAGLTHFGLISTAVTSTNVLTVIATYSDASTETLTATIGETNWMGFHKTGETITSIAVSEVATGAFANYDDVSLAFIPVPEPSSTALLGLGGLALILRRRK